MGSNNLSIDNNNMTDDSSIVALSLANQSASLSGPPDDINLKKFVDDFKRREDSLEE